LVVHGAEVPEQPAFVVARCVHKKAPFLMRFRRRVLVWVCENATDIPARAVSGGDVLNMQGKFELAASYPGCPHCKATSFYLCNCQKLNCWNQQDKRVTCAWCGNSGALEGKISRIAGSAG
jgi:hypothetical protein